MMDLHGLVRDQIQVVNADTEAVVRRSIGYTTAADGKRIPGYCEPVPIRIQVQELSSPELAQVNAMNIQGVLSAVYLPGNWSGIIRGEQKGGDILEYPETPGGEVKTWLIVHVLERFADWTKVVCVLQN